MSHTTSVYGVSGTVVARSKRSLLSLTRSSGSSSSASTKTCRGLDRLSTLRSAVVSSVRKRAVRDRLRGSTLALGLGQPCCVGEGGRNQALDSALRVGSGESALPRADDVPALMDE